MTYFELAMMEHNLIAIRKLYNNISLESLGQLLGIKSSKVCEMLEVGMKDSSMQS